MAIVTSPDEWPVARSSGELIKVQVRPGVYVKMYRDEAIERGYLLPDDAAEKALTPVQNKARRKTGNKGRGTPSGAASLRSE